MSKLIVAEHFYSIQGEGKYIGTPAVFLRLAGCNLKCGFRDKNINSTWVCDTKNVWNKGKFFSIDELMNIFIENHYTEALLNGANLVVTGGEPLLQQNSLYEFLSMLKNLLVRNCKFNTVFEIETNGTININFKPFIKNNILINDFHFNVSPKLINSGEIKEKRNLNIVLDEDFNYLFKDCSKKDYINLIYKFVIGKNDNCIDEILEILQENNIPNRLVYLMPSGETKDEIESNLPYVAELCKKHGFNLSTRLHLHIWNKKTGV